MKTIFESEKQIPVRGTYDIAVAGGGIAGVAAALSAAREGLKTCIIEKSFLMGGLATAGNVALYLPLCDGMGKQIIFGLAEELMHRSVADGFSSPPKIWKNKRKSSQKIHQRYKTWFNPMTFALEMEKMLCENNVHILYDSRVCNLKIKEDTIKSLIIENKNGRTALNCKTVVDASGDADIAFLAEEKTVSLESNVRSGWFYFFDGEKNQINTWSKPYEADGSIKKNEKNFAGDNAEDITQQIIETRNCYMKDFEKKRKKSPDKIIYPVNIPTLPCLRMTRRLVADYELSEKDEGKKFPDSIGECGDWRKNGPVYSIPLRSLTAPVIKNLCTAGKCISSSSAWDITRAIPVCALTGEAAGLACSQAVKENLPELIKADTQKIRKKIRKKFNEQSL